MTPLHEVSFWGYVNVSQLPIENGADVTAKSEDGTTPLHRASERGHVSLANLSVAFTINLLGPPML